MKRNLLCLVLNLVATSALAWPDYEPFNYTSGVNLVGQTNPDGLTWTAAGPPGSNVVVQAGNLTVPGLASPIGNQILFYGATGPSARFPIGPTTNQGTVFFSFALRVADLSGLSVIGDYLAGFNDAVGTQSTTPTVVGTRVLTRLLATTGGYVIGLDKSSGVPDNYKWDTHSFTVNDTVFIVGSYSFTVGAPHTARLWINPNPADFGAATAPPETLNSVSGTDLKQIASFIYFQRPQGVQPKATLADELRIGPTWASVTPPAAQPPANDQCTGAIALTSCDPYTMSTADATSTSDQVPTCVTSFGKGVWFTYTPAADGPITVSTCGSSFDTVLQVYTGNCQALTPVACNNDNGPACGAVQASVTFNGIARTTYYLLAGGFRAASGLLQIRVLDTTPPTVTCPKDIVANTDPGKCSRSNVTFVASASDICGLTNFTCVPPSGSTFPKGVTTVTCSATDTSGNTSQCSFTVTIRDAELPQVTCPKDIVANTDPGQCSKSNVTYVATATDNCPGVTVTCSPPSGSTFAKGVTTVTCTATDASGNTNQCSFTVTIRDQEPPRVTCAPAIVANTDPGQCSKSNVVYTAVATDNCPGVTVRCEPPSGSTFAKGVTTVVCTATDAAGNTNQCSFTVTVRDLEPPRVTCAPDLVANTDPGQCSKSNVVYTAVATDNCPGVTVRCEPPSGSTFAKGVTTVVCTATDVAGNTNQCSFTVTVRDTEPPVVRCPGNIRVTTTNTAGRAVRFVSTASDNCDPAPQVTCTPASGTVFPVGSTRVTCKACDASGNCGTCSFTVTVELQSNVEIDYFPNTLAVAELCFPDGRTDTVALAGPTTVEVSIGPAGQCSDTDGDGRDQAATRMTQLDLSGMSALLGPVTLNLRPVTQHPFQPTLGEVEELANAHPGILDVRPFEPTGSCDSFFDVYFEVHAGGVVLHNHTPKRMRTVIDYKPPVSGTAYEDPTPIPLFDANENPTGYSLCATRHVPEPPGPEIDHFSNTVAQVTICLPDGRTTDVTLNGPTTVEVSIGPAGECSDTDSDGRDQARTLMTELSLSGTNPTLGSVTLNLRPQTKHPFLPTVGEIEEQVNNTPGILDLKPFTATGLCDSFFDVFFEVTVGGKAYHNHSPKRMQTVIDHKPPGPGTAYEDPTAIPLFDDNENPTGIYLCPSRHVPQPPPPEIDYFSNTTAQVTLCLPNGQSTDVSLAGPTTVEVFIGPQGQCSDTDNNGRDQARTLLTQMSLSGTSSTLGLVTLNLRGSGQHPYQSSGGQIEEQVNNTPGTLDVKPFRPIGLCDSFFDVFFEVKVAGMVLHNHVPKRMRTVIDHKPPGPGATYEDPTTIELFDQNENPTGVYLCTTRHVPQPVPTEIDYFPNSVAQVELCTSNSSETVMLAGPTTVEVSIDPVGHAADIDGNGREQVTTRMKQLDLSGVSSLGPVTVRVRDPGLPPFQASTGFIEERVNATAGILDLPPFTATGSADSCFNLYLQLTVQTPNGPLVLHNNQPKRMCSVITHKPPGPATQYENPEQIPLYLENGQFSGFYLCPARHTPSPTNEVDTFTYTLAGMVIEVQGGPTFSVNLAGPTVVQVAIPPNGAAADTDGDGREQVATEMLSMNLSGISPMGPVNMHLNPARHTVGEIEEQANNTAGILDLPPFTATGTADSFFDVFVEVTIQTPNGPLVLHATNAVRMASVITHKPPASGTSYTQPDTQRVALLDPKGNLVAWLTHAAHTPNPPPEIDSFEQARAQMGLQLPNGVAETVQLVGPMQMRVNIPPDGHPWDTDGDGREQVTTEMLLLDLLGASSMGPVELRLNPSHQTLGEIEEVANNTAGVLDVPPFTAMGSADSFFDVFAELLLGGQVFYPAQPIRLQGRITHKPPGPGESYANPSSQPVSLLDATGHPTGIALVREVLTPNPTNEIDTFNYSLSHARIEFPGGPVAEVVLAGSAVERVAVPPNGAASDTDGNGLDQVQTEMLMLDLHGASPIGAVSMHLDPSRPTLGQIEERVNNTPGKLDLPPFTATGTANSFFDIFVEVTFNGQVLHGTNSLHLASVISHKPPGPGESYEYPGAQKIALLGTNGNFVAWLILSSHVPQPPPEIDVFNWSRALVSIQLPNGSNETVRLSGPATVRVDIPPNGQAADTDGNGLDQVPTEMLALDLHGTSSMGAVTMRLDPTRRTFGQIEEQANNTAGILDVPPFTATGSANSFFDVFAELVIGPTVFRPALPVHLQAVIYHKPPEAGETFARPTLGPIPLLTPEGWPTGLFLAGGSLLPAPPQLAIRLVGRDQVEISWPYPSEGFLLQFKETLGPTLLWQTYTGAPQLINNRWVVVMPHDRPLRFYRLFKPGL